MGGNFREKLVRNNFHGSEFRVCVFRTPVTSYPAVYSPVILIKSSSG